MKKLAINPSQEDANASEPTNQRGWKSNRTGINQKLIEKLAPEEKVKEIEEMREVLLVKSRKEDVKWMVAVMLDENDKTPMWTGWNSKDEEINKIKQQVWYLPQINASPTSHAVVMETMKRSIKIADDAGRDSISVTYDLAIAKIALQIQAEEKPRLNRIFVSLGSFSY